MIDILSDTMVEVKYLHGVDYMMTKLLAKITLAAVGLKSRLLFIRAVVFHD